MRIGELAQLSGLSVHSIRWYESQRLIPGVKRTAAGHRDYHEWHVSWLALLHRLKLTGMTISQMTAYAELVRNGESSLAEQRRMFVEHRARAAVEIEEKRLALAHIDAKIEFLDRWIRTGERPPIAKRLMGKDDASSRHSPSSARSVPP